VSAVVQDHADRGHAQWSASATARNWTCAGALAMTLISPEDQESIHAARGTAAHTIAERALRGSGDCDDFLGEIVETKAFKVEVDQELVDSAQAYVDYVTAVVEDTGEDGWTAIEQRFSLAALDPPFDAGGTCDAMIANFKTRTLEVVDLKNGMGVVEVNENKQTRSYALLALLNLDPAMAAKIDRIKVTIVQPRAHHEDGRIRSEEFHIADLIDWTGQLLQAMDRAKIAWDEFHAIGGNRVLFDEWADKHLTPGNCKFCPAEAQCPKLRAKSLEIVPEPLKAWFEEPDAPLATNVSNMPALMSTEDLERTLDGLEMLEDWIKAVRSHGHAQAEKGVKFDHWHLAQKIGNRKWAADDAKVVSDLKTVLKLGDDQIYKRKLASPAQIEKIIGVKRKGEIANMWMKPVTGTNFVNAQKTEREPVQSKAESFFEQPKE
jgi:hypothetical protein